MDELDGFALPTPAEEAQLAASIAEKAAAQQAQSAAAQLQQDSDRSSDASSGSASASGAAADAAAAAPALAATAADIEAEQPDLPTPLQVARLEARVNELDQHKQASASQLDSDANSASGAPPAVVLNLEAVACVKPALGTTRLQPSSTSSISSNGAAVPGATNNIDHSMGVVHAVSQEGVDAIRGQQTAQDLQRSPTLAISPSADADSATPTKQMAGVNLSSPISPFTPPKSAATPADSGGSSRNAAAGVDVAATKRPEEWKRDVGERDTPTRAAKSKAIDKLTASAPMTPSFDAAAAEPSGSDVAAAGKSSKKKGTKQQPPVAAVAATALKSDDAQLIHTVDAATVMIQSGMAGYQSSHPSPPIQTIQQHVAQMYKLQLEQQAHLLSHYHPCFDANNPGNVAMEEMTARAPYVFAPQIVWKVVMCPAPTDSNKPADSHPACFAPHYRVPIAPDGSCLASSFKHTYWPDCKYYLPLPREIPSSLIDGRIRQHYDLEVQQFRNDIAGWMVKDSNYGYMCEIHQCDIKQVQLNQERFARMSEKVKKYSDALPLDFLRILAAKYKLWAETCTYITLDPGCGIPFDEANDSYSLNGVVAADKSMVAYPSIVSPPYNKATPPTLDNPPDDFTSLIPTVSVVLFARQPERTSIDCARHFEALVPYPRLFFAGLNSPFSKLAPSVWTPIAVAPFQHGFFVPYHMNMSRSEPQRTFVRFGSVVTLDDNLLKQIDSKNSNNQAHEPGSSEGSKNPTEAMSAAASSASSSAEFLVLATFVQLNNDAFKRAFDKLTTGFEAQMAPLRAIVESAEAELSPVDSQDTKVKDAKAKIKSLTQANARLDNFLQTIEWKATVEELYPPEEFTYSPVPQLVVLRLPRTHNYLVDKIQAQLNAMVDPKNNQVQTQEEDSEMKPADRPDLTPQLENVFIVPYKGVKSIVPLWTDSSTESQATANWNIKKPYLILNPTNGAPPPPRHTLDNDGVTIKPLRLPEFVVEKVAEMLAAEFGTSKLDNLKAIPDSPLNKMPSAAGAAPAAESADAPSEDLTRIFQAFWNELSADVPLGMKSKALIALRGVWDNFTSIPSGLHTVLRAIDPPRPRPGQVTSATLTTAMMSSRGLDAIANAPSESAQAASAAKPSVLAAIKTQDSGSSGSASASTSGRKVMGKTCESLCAYAAQWLDDIDEELESRGKPMAWWPPLPESHNPDTPYTSAEEAPFNKALENFCDSLFKQSERKAAKNLPWNSAGCRTNAVGCIVGWNANDSVWRKVRQQSNAEASVWSNIQSTVSTILRELRIHDPQAAAVFYFVPKEAAPPVGKQQFPPHPCDWVYGDFLVGKELHQRTPMHLVAELLADRNQTFRTKAPFRFLPRPDRNYFNYLSPSTGPKAALLMKREEGSFDEAKEALDAGKLKSTARKSGKTSNAAAAASAGSATEPTSQHKRKSKAKSEAKAKSEEEEDPNLLSGDIDYDDDRPSFKISRRESDSASAASSESDKKRRRLNPEFEKLQRQLDAALKAKDAALKATEANEKQMIALKQELSSRDNSPSRAAAAPPAGTTFRDVPPFTTTPASVTPASSRGRGRSSSQGTSSGHPSGLPSGSSHTAVATPVAPPAAATAAPTDARPSSAPVHQPMQQQPQQTNLPSHVQIPTTPPESVTQGSSDTQMAPAPQQSNQQMQLYQQPQQQQSNQQQQSTQHVQPYQQPPQQSNQPYQYQPLAAPPLSHSSSGSSLGSGSPLAIGGGFNLHWMHIRHTREVEAAQQTAALQVQQAQAAALLQVQQAQQTAARDQLYFALQPPALQQPQWQPPPYQQPQFQQSGTGIGFSLAVSNQALQYATQQGQQQYQQQPQQQQQQQQQPPRQ